MRLTNKVPEEVSIGDTLVVGGQPYEVKNIQFHPSSGMYTITYENGHTISCSSQDDLTFVSEP